MVNIIPKLGDVFLVKNFPRDWYSSKFIESGNIITVVDLPRSGKQVECVICPHLRCASEKFYTVKKGETVIHIHREHMEGYGTNLDFKIEKINSRCNCVEIFGDHTDMCKQMNKELV